MKKFFILPLFIYSLLSCSKPITEKPVIVKSVTYQRHHYSANDKLSFIDTSIHWCYVGGVDLKRFENDYQKRYFICGTDPEIWGVLVIGPACLTECKPKVVK